MAVIKVPAGPKHALMHFFKKRSVKSVADRFVTCARIDLTIGKLFVVCWFIMFTCYIVVELFIKFFHITWLSILFA